MDVTHRMADLEPGRRLHYVTAAEGERTIVLLPRLPADLVAVALRT
jgi:hypothetical protein